MCGGFLNGNVQWIMWWFFDWEKGLIHSYFLGDISRKVR
jgi:hypothetical protein